MHEMIDPELIGAEFGRVLQEAGRIVVAGAVEVGEGDVRLVFSRAPASSPALRAAFSQSAASRARAGGASTPAHSALGSRPPKLPAPASAISNGAAAMRPSSMIEIARQRLVDLAEEAQREVILLGRAPGRAGHIAFERRAAGRRRPRGAGWRERDEGSCEMCLTRANHVAETPAVGVISAYTGFAGAECRRNQGLASRSATSQTRQRRARSPDLLAFKGCDAHYS